MLQTFDLINGGSIVQAVMPKDLAANAIQGVWASMKGVADCMIVLVLDPGSAGNGPIIALQQATDSAGTGAKVLEITELRYLVAADLTAPGAAAWAEANVSRTNPVASYDTDAVGGDTNEIMVAIRLTEGMFDSGFTHFRINSAACGGVAVRLGHVVYVVKDRTTRGQTKPNLLS